MSDLDPRWEWSEFRRMGDEQPTYVKGSCRHTEVEPVESGGEKVAHLCLTCDAQLPAEWVDRYAEARAQVHRMAEQSRRLEKSILNIRRNREMP